jgi:hypothetical protein
MTQMPFAAGKNSRKHTVSRVFFFNGPSYFILAFWIRKKKIPLDSCGPIHAQ